MAGASLDQSRQRFAERFEPDGEGYIFRRTLKAPGVRVTADERNRFVSEFNRRIAWATYGGATFMVTLMSLVIAWLVFNTRAGEVQDWLIWPLILGLLPLIMLPVYWFWYAPDRAFADRAPIDGGRDKTTARKLAFQRLTWGRLGAGVLLVLLGFLRVSASYDMLSGWGRLWLVFFGGILALAAVQAFRKWRIERT